MCIVFCGVLLIGFAKPINQNNEYTDPSTKVIGFCASLSCAIFFSMVAVLTRKMKEIHFTIVLFYYSLTATVVVFSFMVGFNYVRGEETKLWSYGSTQF